MPCLPWAWWIRTEPGRYRPSAAADAFLARGRVTSAAETQLQLMRSRRRLVEAVRSGQAPADLARMADGAFWACFVAPRLVTWPAAVDKSVAAWAEVGLTPAVAPAARVLDAACGSGVRTYGLAREDPTARVTGLDAPEVLAVAGAIAGQMGVRDQVTLRPGDILTADFGNQEYDAVFFGYVLYFFPPAVVSGILRRAWRALKPGGLVVIRATIADEARSSAVDALLNAVDLLLWVPDSRVYTFSEYRGLLEAAGFGDVTRIAEEIIRGTRPI